MAIGDWFLNLPGSADDGVQVAWGLDVTQDVTGNSDYAITRSGTGATRWKRIDDRYYEAIGVAGEYISTPDSAALDLVNDVRLMAEVAPNDWTPAAAQCLVAKWGAAGQRSYKLTIQPAGTLRAHWTTDGTTEATATSSVATGFTNGQKKHVRCKIHINTDGTWAVDFETSADGITWSALGTQQTGGGGGSGSSAVILGRFASRPASSSWVSPYTSFLTHNDAFNTWLGRPCKAQLDYAWSGGTDVASNLVAIQGACSAGHIRGWFAWQQAAAGRLFMFVIPLGPTVAVTVPTNTLQRCANGEYDAHWQAVADRLFSVTGTTSIVISLGHEMDGDWYAHGNAGPGGVQAPYYAAAFRRAVTVMRARRPTATWKFSIQPTDVHLDSMTWFNQIYAGDSYTDYIGADVYDSGHGGNYVGLSQAQKIAHFNAVIWPKRLIRLNNLKAFAVAHGKKIIFQEWGCMKRTIVGDTNYGDDNPDFIQKMFEWMTDPANVQMHTHLYFDVGVATDNVQCKISPTSPFPNASARYKLLFQNESGSGSSSGISIFVSTAPLELGASGGSGATENFSGKIHSATVENLLTGTTVVSFDPDTVLPSQSTISSVTGETWTLNGVTRITGAEREVMAADTLRLDYDPDNSLELLGLLLEPDRTNNLRNSTMVGAVIGSPGTPPTNWSDSGSANGLTRQIVGFGTEAGMSYIEVLYTGTPSATSGWGLNFETTTQIVAALNDVWTGSYSYKVIGTPTGVSVIGCGVQERTAAGAFLVETSNSEAPVANTMRRNFTTTRTLSNASVARVTNDFGFSYTNGVAVNLRIRIYTPQLEKGGSRTSYIQTSTVAVTRGGEGLLDSSIGTEYSATENSVFVEYRMRDSFNAAKDSTLISFTDNTLNEVVQVRLSTARVPQLRVVDGGAEQALVAGGVAIALNEIGRVSAGWKANEFKCSSQGEATATDTSGTLPTVDRAHIGTLMGNDHYASLHIRRLFWFKKALASATHEALSLNGPVFKPAATDPTTPPSSGPTTGESKTRARISYLETIIIANIAADRWEEVAALEDEVARLTRALDRLTTV